MKRKTAQCMFIFQYLYDGMTQYVSGEWAGGCDGCTTYDDGEDFCKAFSEAFPGRKPDPSLKLASARLRRLMSEMHADGWLDRFRLSNYDQYHPMNEPNWQYVYRLEPWYATRIKEGRYSAEIMAMKYQGDGDYQAALTALYAVA